MRQIELLQFALDVLDRLQIAYALVGSYASGIWGEPRMTLDIDSVVLIEDRHVEPFVEAFAADEFYISKIAIHQAITSAGQFNVIHPTSGHKIDFMVLRQVDRTPSTIARRRLVQITPDLEAYVAAPDDVIVGKLKYYLDGGSDKHLRDIMGILKRSGKLIDFDYVAAWAASNEAGKLWQDLLDQVNL